MTPDGNAITATPNKDDNIEISLPISITGHKSPYLNVVRVTVAQYSASKNELKVSSPVVGLICGSALNIIRAVIKI